MVPRLAVAVLALLALLESSASAQDAAGVGSAAVTAVRVYTTPGKPMELVADGPAEEVTLRADGGKYLLVGHRNVKGFDTTEETVELTREEWEEVVAVVREHALLDWKPERGDGVVFDASTTGFEIKGSRSNAQGFSAPIKNGTGPEALFRIVGKLARAKLKRVRLFYLVP